MELISKILGVLNENPLKIGGTILVILFILWIILGDVYGEISSENK